MIVIFVVVVVVFLRRLADEFSSLLGSCFMKKTHDLIMRRRSRMDGTDHSSRTGWNTVIYVCIDLLRGRVKQDNVGWLGC